jgi:Fe-Mn family superoxide dismutase
MNRKSFLTTAGIGLIAISVQAQMSGVNTMHTFNDFSDKGTEFMFPELPYAFDALEPYIDKMTMEIHYDRHHRGYYTKFMDEVKGTALADKSFAEIFASVSKESAGIRNNGGGFYNHNLFWENLSPDGGEPSEKLMAAINEQFGSFEKFKETFSNAAATRFGSGWAWLVVNGDGKLEVGSTPNQDNPLMDVSPVKGSPILALDVWEHAYYLKYQNKRPDYIGAFWKVVNWDVVNTRFDKATR